MVDLSQTLEIAAPMEVVWAEIAKLGSVQKAMMDTVLRTTLKPGAPLRYTSRNGKRVFIAGHTVEVEELVRLSHTFRLLTRDDPETLVTWTLEEVPRGTKVVRQTGFPDETKGIESVDRTWAGILAQLRRLLETGDISLGMKSQYALMRAGMWMLPAREPNPRM